MWGRFMGYGTGFAVCATGSYLAWEAYYTPGMLISGALALVFLVLWART